MTPQAAPDPRPASEAQDGSASVSPLDLLAPLRSAGSLENPYPVYSLLRTVRPVMEMPVPDFDGPGIWFLTRYEDVHASLRDARMSVDRMRAPLVRENLERLPPFIRQSTQGLRSMLVMDPPDHTRVRKLVNQAFTPRRVAGMREHVAQILDGLLADIGDAGQMDLIHDVAEPLPAIVIAELLGVPPEDHRQFRAWSSQLVASIAARTQRERQIAGVEAAQALLGYLGKVIAERRNAPRDDLISDMIAAQEERDALSDEELLATSNLILLAGHETTTNLIGNGMLALLRNRDQLERMRAEPELLSCATDELLRFDGPVQATVRVALEDIQIDEHTIPAGAMVLLGIGAANHDPAVFDEPEQLDVGRDPNPHIAFGFGAHFCLGSRLARLEAELTFEALCTRYPNLKLLDDAPQYRENPVLRGLKTLQLGF